ncbi:MAG: TraM recognition domain-containing protein [Oculatellaceae cyanobacterium Prado106]|jgi:type IV secretory pathway TraG/TraD family ATPase VirD4|nr:TraM recognition domain-containing protein [Oculatellaceae cyanobacterium Prado106]
MNLTLASSTGRILSETFRDVFRSLFSIIAEVLWSPQILLLLGVLLFLFISQFFTRKRRHLTTARWAGMPEKLAAVRRAKAQLRSRKIDDVILWCGTPPRWQTWGLMPEFITLVTGNPPTVYLTDANQSFAIAGRPKSGKTYSAINPMTVSAIEQGLAIALYDYKADDEGNGGQMAYLATLAVRHGYTLRIFSPGRPYTCIINPLDFLQDESDDTTAGMLAEVFHMNLKQETDKGDAFFGPAGQRLLQALFQFAKSTDYPDLGMAFTVLQLTNLPARLAFAVQRNQLPMFVRISFSQLISTLDSEKTTASIISTAANVLNRFISLRILPSMMGKTNVSLLLGRKEMLVFQSDIFRQDVINPILAAILHVVLQKNFSIQRMVPLIFCADEFPTLYLPKAPTWANEHRSKGFVGIYGYQSLPQLRDSYGAEKSNILLAGLGTQFWFNPNHYDTAKDWEDSLGETELWIQSKSWSRSPEDWGGGRSRNEQIHKRSLIAAEELMQFGQGECILRSPGYKNRRRTAVPWHIRQIRVGDRDRERERHCVEIWNEKLRERLIEREQQQSLDIQEELLLRYDEAERLLPLPPGKQKRGAVPGGILSPDF